MRTPALKFCTLVVAIAVMIASNPQHPLAQTTAPASPVSAPTTSGKASTYAAESIVIEHSDSVYTYAADGTGTHEQTLVVRVQSEAAVHSLGVIAVPYAANSQRVEFLYARVRHPDGTTVETQPSDALDMPDAVTREAPFYSDLKEKQLPIRSLRVGDTLEWKARVTTTKPEAPGEFWGQESFVDDAVALAETIELRVPATVSVNVWSPTSKPTESTADGMQVYRWASSQLKPTAGKEAEAEAETKKKAVWTADQELDADQGKLPAIAWTTFKSWADVGTWYQSLEADRVSPNSEVKAKVAELIAGKTTDEEKIRALYAYVSTQIRYIGVAFGIGRYPILHDGGLSWGLRDMTVVHQLKDIYDIFTREQIAIYPLDPNGVGAPNLMAQAVADETGGATSNSNDFQGTIAKIVDDTLYGYTLSYVPTRPDEDGHYHAVTIKLNRPGLHLNYRPGYNDEQPLPPDAVLKQHMIQGPIRLGAIPATQILFDLQVQPASSSARPAKKAVSSSATLHTKGAPYTVLFTFDPTQITLTETPDGTRTANIELDLGAFDFFGKLVATRSQTFKITVTPAQYNGFFRTPLKFSLPIDLPRGQLKLHAGVFDTAANKAGTLEIALTVGKGSTAYKTDAATTPSGGKNVP
jgi:hypothetical protein